MSLYSRLDRLAADVAKLYRKVDSVSNAPQGQRTSIEGGGSFEFNDEDGNLKAIVGGQDDGGTTIQVISGPTPPTPVGFTVEVDHGKFIVHWSGDFEGDKLAPSDWSRAEVHASQDPFFVPSRATARGSIVSAAGGEVTIGVLKGQWTIKMLAWSQAGKMSAPSAPVDVEVPGYGEIVLEEIDASETDIKNGNSILVNAQDTLGGKLDSAFGQLDSINDDLSDLGDAVSGAVESANGKNTVHYEDHAPTSSDEGAEGDTWFVGQVGRPDDVVEATNHVLNPSAISGGASWRGLTYSGATATDTFQTHLGKTVYRSTLTSGSGYVYLEPAIGYSSDLDTLVPVTPGEVISGAMLVARSYSGNANLRFGFRSSSGSHVAWSSDGPVATVNSSGFTRLVIENKTVPANAAYAFVHVSTTSGSGEWVEGAGAIISKTATAPDFFDGDTEDGATPNDPHYRWTGTPHASTSEKYLPATEGLSSNWNVTEQYRFQSGAWVQVELSHTVLSSLDLGKLVVGSAAIKEAVIERLWADVVVQRMSIAEEFIGENAILTGAVTAPKITASEELWAKIAEFVKIRAEHIEADAIDGMVITGPNIRTSATGARVQMDPNGVRVFNAENEVRTHLSPDGSTFKGEVEAETLVVNDGAEFKGNNTLAQGSSLLLAAGVTDPTAPPVVQPYWNGLEFTPANINGSNPVGLAWDGTNYITVGANRATTGVASYFTGVYAMKINGATGEASRLRWDFSAASSNEQRVSEVFGVTCIGSELFFLGRYGYAGYVWVTDLDGVFKRRLPYDVLGYSSTNRLVYRPAIGNDGTNIVTAQCTDAGRTTWRVWNKTTGAQISYTEEGNDNAKTDFTGVHIGAADWGGTFVTLAKKKSGEVVTFNTSGVYDGAKTFNAATPNSTGVVYVNGKWRTLDPTGVIHEYGNNNTGDNSGDWWATYYWYTDVNGNNIIESSDYRSRMAPPARFVWPRRAMLKILGQPMPTDVGALGPALAKKATKPTRADFHGPGWSVDTGKPSARYTELPTNWTTFASPSDTNTFPEATSSALESASGTFRVLGDGSGHWGPLTMGRNGIMSGLIVSGVALLAVDADNTTKKFTINLPAGRFTKPPLVWLNVSTATPQNVWAGVVTEAITTSTFEINFRRTTTAATGVAWFAMDSE